MKTIDIKDTSSIMIFTGSNSLDTALALENREYNYEDEYLGVLTKTKTNDSAWSNLSKEVFVETTPKYNDLTDLYVNGYSYIITKSVAKPQSEYYLDSTNHMNFRYSYEGDLSSNIENAKVFALEDLKLGLRSINNSMYNKQRFYAENNELDFITHNGVKYYWYGEGSVLEETYTGVVHNIGADFISYEMNSHSVQAEVWDELTQSYVPQFETKIDPETGNETQTPVMTTKYSLKYLDSLYTVLADKVNAAASRHIEQYGDMAAYYLYELNNRVSFVASTYSFGKTDINMLVNYDGELNNWYNNSIRLNLKGLTPESTNSFVVRMSESYPIDVTLNENETLLDDKAHNYGLSDEIVNVNTLSNESIEGVRIMAPHKIAKLDLSLLSSYLYDAIDLNPNYDKKINYQDTVRTCWNDEKGHTLEEFILGNEDECEVTNIYGISDLTNLKSVSLKNCKKLSNDIDFTTLENLNNLVIDGTNLSSVKLANKAELNNLTILNTAINSLVLNENVIDSLQYIPTADLTTLELNNVTINNYNETSDDTIYSFVSNWIEELIKADKLNSGLVNYVNLNGIDWQNADLRLLYQLKDIELNEITGRIKVHDLDSEIIERRDYRKLLNLYGEDIVKEDNKLYIDMMLDPNAFNVKMDIIKKQINETTNEFGDITTTEEEVLHDSLILTINDDLTGNSLLDYLQDNKTEGLKFTDYKNDNKQKVGLVTTLDHKFEMNVKSEKPKQLEVGDVLLYNLNQLIIITKNSTNINTNYIKLGKFEDITKISQLTGFTFEWKVNLMPLEIIEQQTPEVEENENDSEE